MGKIIQVLNDFNHVLEDSERVWELQYFNYEVQFLDFRTTKRLSKSTQTEFQENYVCWLKCSWFRHSAPTVDHAAFTIIRHVVSTGPPWPPDVTNRPPSLAFCWHGLATKV